MNFNTETTSTLFHYCNEIANSLRGVLNTHKFEDMDEMYFTDKLIEFKQVINNCLELEQMPKANYDFIREAHLRIFGIILSEWDSDLMTREVIVGCNNKAKIIIRELYGVES